MFPSDEQRRMEAFWLVLDAVIDETFVKKYQESWPKDKKKEFFNRNNMTEERHHKQILVRKGKQSDSAFLGNKFKQQ